MKTEKLSTGFLLIDLEGAPTSVGVVRSAPKILVGGAELLARSVTYAFALFSVQAGGASGGVNAKPDERRQAVKTFAAEVAANHPTVVLDAGKGVEQEDLAALPRPPEARSDEVLAAGALAATVAVSGELSGKRIAIEGFGPAGLAVARLAMDAGAGVVAVGTDKGTAIEPEGFDLDALPGLTDSSEPAWAVWGADADVVFCGSKTGAMTHEGAAMVRARTIVPIGPAPITAKSLAVLGRAGIVYVPDFLATAAPLLARVGGPTDAIAEVATELSGHPDGLFLGACERAETFLRSWVDQMPFGRPLA